MTDLDDYQLALRAAGEIVARSTRGTTSYRLTSGITDAQIARISWWLLKANEALEAVHAAERRAAQDAMEPHADPCRQT